MRIFKRLLPVLLISVLLAGVALARPAGLIRPSNQLTSVATPQAKPAYDNPRFNFGTVVRDTADDQSFNPGRSQLPREVSPWDVFFSWSWVTFLIQR